MIERAADVVLKERRQLVIVPREAPYSSIHLENMLKLSNMGAVILPASPGFYHQPQSIDDLVDFVVARILNILQIPQDMLPRWGEHHQAGWMSKPSLLAGACFSGSLAVPVCALSMLRRLVRQ